MSATAEGTFAITMTPADHDQEGIGRMTFTKTWSGDLDGTGVGTMLSAGRPDEGRAGYVAVETVTGSLGGSEGSLAFQQFGTMTEAGATQHYEVVPGSGTGALAGLTGTLSLTVADGIHRYVLTYDV